MCSWLGIDSPINASLHGDDLEVLAGDVGVLAKEHIVDPEVH